MSFILPEFESVQFRKRDGKTIFWKSNPGNQSYMLVCQTAEVLVGGERGSGMTTGLLAWFAMGSRALPEGDPAIYSYLLDKSFRGLLLTPNYRPLDRIDEIDDMWAPLGGRLNEKESAVSFRSGARILIRNIDTPLNRLPEAFTRIGIDGLTHIAREKRYLSIASLLRNVRRDAAGNTIQALPCQIMSTARCEGPGLEWVYRRFVSVKNKQGAEIEHGRVMSDTQTGLARTFIPMKLKENQYLRENEQYVGIMRAQDELTRRAWMEGDWSAFMPQETPYALA